MRPRSFDSARRVELVLISLGRFARQRLDAVLALVEIIGAQLVVAVLFEQTQMRTRSRLRTLFVRAPFCGVAQARHFVPLVAQWRERAFTALP